MTNKIIRIGLVKHVPKMLKPTDNLDILEELAHKACKNGVKLFVTCEAYLDGYYSGQGKENFEREKLLSVSYETDSALVNKVIP